MRKKTIFYEVLNHSAAVYGYHYYKKYCVSVEDQELDCLHEVDTPYDYFAIKTCESVSGKTVGHFPMEISRPTKALLQLEAMIKVTYE